MVNSLKLTNSENFDDLKNLFISLKVKEIPFYLIQAPKKWKAVFIIKIVRNQIHMTMYVVDNVLDNVRCQKKACGLI